MKFLLLFYSGCLLLFADYDPGATLDCSQIRNGRFYYFAKLTNERVKIERRDSLQIETRLDGQQLRSKVMWKGDCSFDLFLNAYSTSQLSLEDSVVATIPIHFQVNAIEKDYYVCTGIIESPGVHMEIRDTIYIDRSPI